MRFWVTPKSKYKYVASLAQRTPHFSPTLSRAALLQGCTGKFLAILFDCQWRLLLVFLSIVKCGFACVILLPPFSLIRKVKACSLVIILPLEIRRKV